MKERPDKRRIDPEELDWEQAEVHEGRPHGTVVSVRMDAAEAERLRTLASQLGLNMSQVLRRALADFEPQPRALLTWHAFTFGGVDWPMSLRVHPEIPVAESSTELRARIRERVQS